MLCFNPRPSLSRGEAVTDLYVPPFDVCFNPRPSLSRGEAKVKRESAYPSRCFNPRPSLSRGEAAIDQVELGGVALVSIHAPRCRGAKPVTSTPSTSREKFQSTPLVVEGRSQTPTSAERKRQSFNPRPSLSRGEAVRPLQDRGRPRVSIHAPRCRGAKHAAWDAARGAQKVSIHAPRCRGAKPATTC